MTEALKKTLPFGQVKLLGWPSLQMSVIWPNAHSITPSWTRQDQIVATTWAKNMEPLWDLEIMTEFQVGEERVGLIHGDVAVRFEQHHCHWASRLHVSDDVFGKDVQPEMDVCRGVDDPDRDGPDDSYQESYDQCPPGEIRWPSTHTAEAHGGHYDQEDSVPPPGDFFILTHHLRVIVVQRSSKSTGLDPDFLAVEQDGVEDHSCNRRKSETIRQRECS